MRPENLSVNDNIEIEIKKGYYKGQYQSRISDKKKNELYVLMPYNEGNLVPIGTGTEVEILIASELAAHKFKSKVINQIKEPVPQLILEMPDKEDFIKIQRRKYFRLEVKRKVLYRRVDKDWEPEEQEYTESSTIDISGGGIKMVLNEELPNNIFIELMLDIPAIEGVKIISETIRKYELPDGKAVGIEFLNINHRTRDALMGWLFDYQRKLRRKGLI
ncbi:MAG: flagellar brake protein [Bacillota bacterium]